MNASSPRSTAAALLALLVVTLSQTAQGGDRVIYIVAPNEADPEVKRFLRSSVVLFDSNVSARAPLLVFLPGTGGDPGRVQLFLNVAVDAGYRAIGLSYDNEPAVMGFCAGARDPSCSENFRQSRFFGGTDTPHEESIVTRLTKLLNFLDSRHPEQDWRGYLANDNPDWSRIAVAGHSQGGGMAALLAKRVALTRVILLSGPPDFVMPSRQPAPWLAAPAVTPIDRWYGLYHRDETLAPLLQRAYAALGLAADHIRVVTLAPAAAPGPAFPDAYHVSVVADRLTPRAGNGSPAYTSDWDFLLGRAQ